MAGSGCMLMQFISLELHCKLMSKWGTVSGL